AGKMLQQAMNLGIQDSEVYYLLGLSHMKQQNNMLAIPFLQRAAELNNDTDIKFQYGLVLAKTNYLKEAEKMLTEVIMEKPTHADALYNLGILKLHEEKLAEAIDFIDRAI